MRPYKLFKYLFGWDYILWENTCASGITRVRCDGNGIAYYRVMIYGTYRISNPSQVLWLTCSSDKYMKPQLKSGQIDI